MRRVGRGGSPEVVVGACDYSSPGSSAETNFRELDDVFLQTQTRIWLGEVLHLRFDEETSIADLLADGELLFQVSKVVWKMLLKKHAELKYSKMNIHERTSSCKSGGRYMPYPKVDSFLKICQILGLTGVDLFSPSDVVEKRDTRRVCMCVRSLSKKARMKDLNVPDFDIVANTIAMPTYMVGCIRRCLEQSWWSSSSSNSCIPCIDLKEIYRQRSLDSDYPWNHSECSESDDAEEPYMEYELQSPASITSYYDADISSLIGENLPGRGPVSEENICPQNFFTLDTWEQDEDMFSSVQSVETCTDTSMPFAPLNASNGNFQLTIMHCGKSFQSCRSCQAHMDARTSFSCMEDISWLQTKTSNGTDIHQFDFGQPPVCASSFTNLGCESDSCSKGNPKEENYEITSSSLRHNGSIEKFLPESYANLESLKDNLIKAPVSPPVSSVTEDHDSIESTCMLLLDKVTKKNGKHVLKCNGEFSEYSSGLSYSFCENRRPELHADTARNALWNGNNGVGLNVGIWENENLMVRPPITQSDNLDSIHPNTDTDYSVFVETVARDQSRLHIKALNANPGHLKENVVSEDGDAKAFLIVSGKSGNTATVVSEDLSDISNDCMGGCLQFPDFHSPKIDAQIDLTNEVTMKGLPNSVDEESSVFMFNEVPLNGNISDPMPGKLYKHSVVPADLDRNSAVWHASQASIEDSVDVGSSPLNGNMLDPMSGKLHKQSVVLTDLDRNSAVWHESQASIIDSDPQIFKIQNLCLLDAVAVGISHIGSVSEKLCSNQVPVGCSKSNSNCIQRNEDCCQSIDIMKGASDSSIDHGKHLNRLVSHYGNAFSATKEQSMDSCAQLHNQTSSSDSFTTLSDSPIQEDLGFNKSADEDGESCSSSFEHIKQILVNSFSMKNLESQSIADCLSKVSASFDNEETKSHQTVAIDGKSCTRSMDNKVVDNLRTVGFSKQTTVALHHITQREEKSLLVEPSQTCSPCCRMYNESVELKPELSVEPCTKNSMAYCVKDKEQQSSDHTNISGVPKERISTHNETVSRSLYLDESSVSTLHLDLHPIGNEVSEGLCQENIQELDSDMSVGACLPLDFPDRQASVDTWHDELDQTEACALKTGDSEVSVGYNEGSFHTSYLDTNIRRTNLVTPTQVGTSDFDVRVDCDSISSIGNPEFRSSCVQRERSLPSSTICMSDMKNSALESTEMNNHHEPLMDQDADSRYWNYHGSIQSIKKDAEDGDLNRRTTVRADERESEEAAISASKPAKKMLLKSFAGVTLIGALFLLLHFRGRRERGRTIKNVVKVQSEKAGQERLPDKDRHGALYPAENFKF